MFDRFSSKRNTQGMPCSLVSIEWNLADEGSPRSTAASKSVERDLEGSVCESLETG